MAVLKIGTKLYNVAELVDKTIYSGADTPIYRSAEETAKAVYTTKKGQAIGKLYSYLSPSANRKFAYLMFYDTNNRPYYVRMVGNTIDVTQLKRQGVKDTEEIIKDAEKANKSWFDKGKNVLYTVVLIGAIAYIAKGNK